MIAAVVALPACSHRQPPPDQVYTVRGVITGLPVADKPASELTIRHEAIPTFRDREGNVIGMASMEMPFSPARGVSLKELKVGDPVEFTLEIRQKPTWSAQVSEVHKLPPDARLEFGKPIESR
jgi:Cu/Ag efflux protein CusF